MMIEITGKDAVALAKAARNQCWEFMRLNLHSEAEKMRELDVMLWEKIRAENRHKQRSRDSHKARRAKLLKGEE